MSLTLPGGGPVSVPVSVSMPDVNRTQGGTELVWIMRGHNQRSSFNAQGKHQLSRREKPAP